MDQVFYFFGTMFFMDHFGLSKNPWVYVAIICFVISKGLIILSSNKK